VDPKHFIITAVADQTLSVYATALFWAVMAAVLLVAVSYSDVHTAFVFRTGR
jgi:hypothetical protein